MSNEDFGLATEKFFYYCMGLRKGDMQNQVINMQARFPDDSPERLARRFIAAQIPLSMVGSTLIHAPTFFPLAGPAFRFLGLASGTTLMMVLNMTLFLQIGLIYGYPINDRARIKELLAIITATSLTSSSTALLPQFSGLTPGLKALAGGAAVITTSQLVGEAALRYFKRKRASADGSEIPANAVAA